ncbi:MAG: Ig-like domain-containing protein [Chloroflexi bacterium]|nr:Ig-like domain-containing protein [Chloroflexota bacterium]
MGDFPQATQNGNCGTSFIEDGNLPIANAHKRIDDPTSTKQNVNSTTGLVVAASDNITGHVYVHNVLGDPPPVVTSFGPAPRGANNVATSAVISATFSKAMDPATFNSTNFSVLDSTNTPVAGNFAYNGANRILTFTPAAPLSANSTYTVTLTKGLKDSSAQQSLYQRAAFANQADTREQWSFKTAGGTVQFNNTAYSVNENGGTATITVTLNTPSESVVTVNYATSDGTATQPGNYTATSGTLTFNPGDPITQTFQVPVANNGTNDGNKTVNLTLSASSGASLGTPSTALLTIIDDEGPPTAQFSLTNYNFPENVAGGNATITVILNQPSATPITVDYATSNGTATAGTDYTAKTGTLTFLANVTSQSFTVAINNDTTFEPNETVNLTLSNPNPNTVQVLGPAVLTIVNDDLQPKVQFSAATYSATEGDTATINVTLSNPSASAITVNYATSDSTASSADYTAAGNTLTFAPGETSKPFDVATLPDSLSEPDEVVNLTLSNPTNATFAPGGDSATLTIVDASTAPTIQFSSATYSVNENVGSGVATILVTLSAASAQPVEVGITTSDGTATASDYATVDDFLTIDAGLTSGTFEVPITNDNAVEGDETVNLTLSNPSNAVLGTAAAVLTIVDDDTNPNLPTVQFSAATYNVAENGGTATITVTVTGAHAQPVTVNYATIAGGTATAGTDYTFTPGTLTFTANETVKTFTVTILDDTLVEPNETVNLTLSGATNVNNPGTQSAVLTIVDNDVTPTPQPHVYLPLILKR